MSICHVRWIGSKSKNTNRVLSYAGRELARYLRKLTGQTCDTRRAGQVGSADATAWLGVCDQMPDIPGARMDPAPWDDGFGIWLSEEGLMITGRNARSVLFGVYAFLEQQGVRFLRPGPDGEIIPRASELILPEQPVVQQPYYRHRGVCIEGAPSVDHALGMVDWCAKKRMNTIFLQFLSSRYFYNNWYERKYNPRCAGRQITEQEALALDDRVIAAMKRRGMVFHRVGHGWTSAAFEMPRSGWVEADEPVKPEYVRWLAEVNGERKLFGNIPINTELCYSYRPAFDRFVENIVNYCESHPELDVVHVWLSDAANNKCECAECRKLSISDWYAKIINALSQALHDRVPGTRFVFLCYIELLWPPEQVAIDERYGNAIMMFAPITRCYGHSLGDPSCDDGKDWPRPPLNRYVPPRCNAFFVKELKAWREIFKGDSFDFDYHLMWDVWRQLTDTAIAKTYYADLQQLKDLGLDGIVSCQSFRAFYPSGLAMTTLAEALWNPHTPWQDLRRGYLEDAYGPYAAFADSYLDQVEHYLDTGDPHRRLPPFSNADIDKLAAAARFLETTQAQLEDLRQGSPPGVHRRSLDLLRHHARLLQFIVTSYQARLGGDTTAAQRELDNAVDFLQRTERRFSPWIDTGLAIQHCVESHR